MTSRTPLREVLWLNRKRDGRRGHLDYLSQPPLLPHCPLLGEDPLAGDQNDHDMDSIAGVLKLYFRGLDHALFPKEVFHDLISCVCTWNVRWFVFCSPCVDCDNNHRGGGFVLFCIILQQWRASRRERSTSRKFCNLCQAKLWLLWDTCLPFSTSEYGCSWGAVLEECWAEWREKSAQQQNEKDTLCHLLSSNFDPN